MKTLFAFVLAVLSFAYTNTVQAGYAQLKPPPGWSQGMGAAVPGQSGVFAFGAAANAASFKGSTVLTNAALSVAGQYVVVPVAMRTAANAAAVAAEWSFGNPLLFAGLLAAPIAYKWFTDQDFAVINGSWQKSNKTQTCVDGTCYEYSFGGGPWGSKSSAISAGLAARTVNNDPNESFTLTDFTEPGTQNYTRTYLGTSSQGSFQIQRRSVPPSEGTVWSPVLKPEFIERMKNQPIPAGVPQQLPDVKWPVEDPVFNPAPTPAPLPSPNPKQSPRPLWVPTGDPVASSPATSPQTWTQPGQNVTASPTSTDPWRVNIEPLPKTKTNATPNTGAETVTDPEVANPSDPGAASPESEPLCELFPDILACAKLGSPVEPAPVNNTNKPMTITKESGFGPSDGSCPAPRAINLSFGTVDLPWTSICGLAEGMRPFFIAFAYLGAALSFFGIGRKS